MSESQQPSLSNSEKDKENSLLGKSGGGNITLEEKPSSITKSDVLSQLDPPLIEQLSPHIWEIINYNPLELYIAHRERKQIILAAIKTNKIHKHDPFTNLSLTSQINSINLSKIIIGAIPVEISRNEDPLGLSKENKYTIKFETQIETLNTFTLGPNSLDEIVQKLHNRTLILDSNKAGEALSAIILSMEKDNKVTIKRDIITPGYYLVDDKITTGGKNNDNINNQSNNNLLKEIIGNCLDLLELLQQKFKNGKVFPTIIKWSCIAPFVYVMKQKENNKMWIPWLYLYGCSRTGKTTLGDISCAIQGNYQNEKYKIPFTNVDTVAKLGEALSKSTFPLVINESGGLSDDSKYYKNLIEMIKTAIEGPIARSKFLHKTIYTEIPSFCACIFTSNSAPPSDMGFRRRIIAIPFTQKDAYTVEERIEFEKLLNQRVTELKVLGDFAATYIIKNQDLILDDTNKKDWDEIAKLVLYEMYKIVERKPQEWIEYKIDSEIQFQENKEDLDLILRIFFINKLNETYIRYHKSIDPSISIDGINQPFNYRLNFCLEYNLIPFLNKNSKDEIIITSDLIQELRNHRIYGISSLQEVSNIIDGFERSQKKLRNRTVRAAYGSVTKLLEFLDMNVENNDNVLLDNNNDTISSKFSTNDRKSLDTKENEINFNYKNDDGVNAESLYECYYCYKFPSTTDEVKYQTHVISSHPKKRLYPVLSELKEMGIEPKGKRWEV
jgi:hypothetical protein